MSPYIRMPILSKRGMLECLNINIIERKSNKTSILTCAFGMSPIYQNFEMLNIY